MRNPQWLGAWSFILVSGVCGLNAVSKPDEGTGQNRVIADLGIQLVWIAPGEFDMGSPNGSDSHERPVTRVNLTRGYWLGKTEITQAQWVAVMDANPSKFIGADQPVEQVTCDEALEFCRRLTEREREAGRLPLGFKFTLPTEAQWEFACRAGRKEDAADDLAAVAWYAANSGGSTHPVGQKQANAWGLHDMHGNVWEFCLGRYGPYPGGTVADPAGAPSGPYGIFRGGSWNNGPVGCRTATRHGYTHGRRAEFIGFRLALSAVTAG